MNVTGRGGSAASASAKIARTSSGDACFGSSWPPELVCALAYALFSTISRPPSCTTTAPTAPPLPGSSTTRSARDGGAAAGGGAGGGAAGGAAQPAATTPARMRPERRCRPPLRRAVARTNDELRAAHAEDRRRRLDPHGVGCLLGNAARDDRQRALGERRFQRP